MKIQSWKLGVSASLAVIGHFLALAATRDVATVIVFWVVLLPMLLGVNIIMKHITGKGLLE